MDVNLWMHSRHSERKKKKKRKKKEYICLFFFIFSFSPEYFFIFSLSHLSHLSHLPPSSLIHKNPNPHRPLFRLRIKKIMFHIHILSRRLIQFQLKKPSTKNRCERQMDFRRC